MARPIPSMITRSVLRSRTTIARTLSRRLRGGRRRRSTGRFHSKLRLPLGSVILHRVPPQIQAGGTGAALDQRQPVLPQTRPADTQQSKTFPARTPRIRANCLSSQLSASRDFTAFM
ncbi:hypothetical protein EYF80_053991 [Liparis tanakae]|uniref:Uncharacterized protein n=1 Tax=Liparis tanakae TaxID=230148 RepID=A0A4Z2F4N0_9TELE|nr:hypothetical protein EYF80_053991 [Liparis tanakae]